LIRAFLLAAWGHRKQRDKAGERYIWHLVRVAWIAYGLTGDVEAAVVGLLHDYIEDVDVASHAQERMERRFGGMTAKNVWLLTVFSVHSPSVAFPERGYADYIERIVRSQSRIAIAVKIADLLDNTNPRRRRKAGISEEQTVKYLRALAKLAIARATMEG